MATGELEQGRFITPSPSGARTSGATCNVSTLKQSLINCRSGKCLDSSNETTIAENVKVSKSGQDDPGHDLKDKYSTVVNYALIVCACYPGD